MERRKREEDISEHDMKTLAEKITPASGSNLLGTGFAIANVKGAITYEYAKVLHWERSTPTWRNF